MCHGINRRLLRTVLTNNVIMFLMDSKMSLLKRLITNAIYPKGEGFNNMLYFNPIIRRTVHPDTLKGL